MLIFGGPTVCACGMGGCGLLVKTGHCMGVVYTYFSGVKELILETEPVEKSERKWRGLLTTLAAREQGRPQRADQPEG
jgi:hypothetical protein